MEQEIAQKKKKPIGYIELLRVIACFLVIVNHTNSGIFMSRTPEALYWKESVTYFFVSKVAVPIFLMISGALMLGKVEPWQKHAKRAVRIILDIVIFSWIVYAYGCHQAGMPVDMMEFFKGIWQRHFSNAYWYMYLYLGILIMMPFLQRLSVNMSRNAQRYLILLSVVYLGTMPILAHYFPGLELHGLISEPFLSVYIGIMFLGYYLAHEVEVKHIYAAISVAVFVVLVSFQVNATYWEYVKTPEYYLFFDDRTFITITASAAAVFYLARWFGTLIHSEWFWKPIAMLGSCSFGVYLLSDLLINVFALKHMMLAMQMDEFAALLIYEFMVFGAGIVITAILKQIPGIKKLM